jgi:Cu(I)/Ag(I) efflux system periplasmic protein CusF
MIKTTMLSISAAVLVFAVNLDYAADTQSMGNMNMQQEKSGSSVQMHKGHGVVNKINAGAGKVNISHEPIASMGWPKMTMDFTVQNKADLAAIKPGMVVDFDLAQQGKGYRISHIAPAKE